MTAPPPVLLTVRLMLLRSAVSVVSVIVQFATWDDLRRRYLDKHPTVRPGTVDTTLTFAAVFSIVLLLFYAFLAFQVRRGANWARIVTWVIAGLGIIGALVSFGEPDSPLSRTLGIVIGFIDLAVVVLLLLPESNRYFVPEPHR